MDWMLIMGVSVIYVILTFCFLVAASRQPITWPMIGRTFLISLVAGPVLAAFNFLLTVWVDPLNWK